MNSLENNLKIRCKVGCIGEDDEIERSIELEYFRRLSYEDAVRESRSGPLYLAAGKVRTGNVAIRQESKKFATSATDFEDAGIGRDKKPVVVRE